ITTVESICDSELTVIPSDRWKNIIIDGIYEFGSLRERDNYLSMLLRNPPGQVGVFNISIAIDGKEVGKDNILIRKALKEPDFISAVDLEKKGLELSPGEMVEIKIKDVKLESGKHRFDIVFHDESIPGRCWLSFIDEVI
ncbi:MAG: hypothetical protein QXL15_02665, partial [Candidatus Korarchaeota archaeon]